MAKAIFGCKKCGKFCELPGYTWPIKSKCCNAAIWMKFKKSKK